jgi:hypothetical protein
MTLRHRERRASAPVTRALGAVCRVTWPSVDLTATQIDEFVDAARLHRIAPLAHVVTRGSADEISARLREDRDRAMAVTMRATYTLGLVARTLDGLPWLTFKGPVLSALAHPVPGLRTFSDLDVLIDPISMREANDRLRDASWRLLDYEDMLAGAHTPGEMHWLSPQGLQLDLHWSMINSATLRERFDVVTRDLLHRRGVTQAGLATVPTLDPADTLNHTCLHAALDGAARLLQLLDADGVARRITDWDAVVERARRWRSAEQVWLVLTRARAVVGTPLPDGLSGALGVGVPLRKALATIDGLAPVTAVRSPHGLARFGARAARPTLNATLALGTHNAVLGVIDRLRQDSRSGAVRIPATDAAIERYIRSVEATAGPADRPPAPMPGK